MGLTVRELLSIAISRELRDGEVVVTGAASAVPLAACLLAQARHAPGLTILGAGVYINPRRLVPEFTAGWDCAPVAIADMADVFAVTELGIDVMFYGGMQIDRGGSVNLHSIPTATGRLRGPGLANSVLGHTAARTILYTERHDRRTLVDEVDYASVNVTAGQKATSSPASAPTPGTAGALHSGRAVPSRCRRPVRRGAHAAPGSLGRRAGPDRLAAGRRAARRVHGAAGGDPHAAPLHRSRRPARRAEPVRHRRRWEALMTDSAPALGFAPITLSGAERELMLDVRRFARAAPFPPSAESPTRGGFDRAFSEDLARHGWAGMTIPARYGGSERSGVERCLVASELLAAGAPLGAHWTADRQTAPSLLRNGPESLRAALLPLIAASTAARWRWFSEFDAGATRESARTRARAVRRWRITGSQDLDFNGRRPRGLPDLRRTSDGGGRKHRQAEA